MNGIVSLIKAIFTAAFGAVIANALSKTSSKQNELGATLSGKLAEVKTKVEELDAKFDQKVGSLATNFSDRVTESLNTFATDLAATQGVTADMFLSKATTLDKFSLDSLVSREQIVAALNSKMPSSFTQKLAIVNGAIVLVNKTVA